MISEELNLAASEEESKRIRLWALLEKLEEFKAKVDEVDARLAIVEAKPA